MWGVNAIDIFRLASREPLCIDICTSLLHPPYVLMCFKKGRNKEVREGWGEVERRKEREMERKVELEMEGRKGREVERMRKGRRE